MAELEYISEYVYSAYILCIEFECKETAGQEHMQINRQTDNHTRLHDKTTRLQSYLFHKTFWLR